MESNKWVFLPGIFGSNAALRLSVQDERFVMMDLPGTGSSETAAMSIQNQLESAAVSNYVVIGSSYGSLVALQLAKLMPQECMGVVLLNPPSLATQVLRTYLVSALASLSTLSWLLPRAVPGRAISRLVSSDPVCSAVALDPAGAVEYRDAVARTLRSVGLVVPRVIEVIKTDIPAWVRAVQKPVLVMRGDHGPLVLYHGIPSCDTCALSSGGHLPLISNTAECVERIEHWISANAVDGRENLSWCRDDGRPAAGVFHQIDEVAV